MIGGLLATLARSAWARTAIRYGVTPPFGLTVYPVKSTISDRSTTLGAIFAGTFPFVLMVTLVLTFVPALSLVFE